MLNDLIAPFGASLEACLSSFVCAGDTALEPGLASLSYGTAARVGGSECISRDDGVTCVNQAGHGFFISVQSYQVF